MMDILIVSAIIILNFITIFCSAFYFSVIELPENVYRDFMDQEKRRGSLVESYHQNTEKTKRIYLMLTLVNGVLSQIFGAFILSKYLDGIGFVCLFLVAIFLVYLCIAIYLPYYVFTVRPLAGVRYFAWIFRLVHLILFPCFFLSDRLAYILAILFVGKQKNNIDEVTEEEILTMVSEGNETGAILPSEAQMVQNVFELDDKCVKDIMIHRNDIESLDGNMDLHQAILRFQSCPYSRLPVYLDSLDNIIGIIHIKDILDLTMDTNRFHEKLRDMDDLLRPAETVPETHGIYTLLTTMKLLKMHMAIVVDEYGQTSGLVSMEDIIEEIVGNIQDEHDNDPKTVQKIRKDEFRMEGKTPLEEVNEILHSNLQMEDIETLNGFLINRIGRIPEENETFTIHSDGYVFHVLGVHNRMISEVLVTQEEPNQEVTSLEDDSREM